MASEVLATMRRGAMPKLPYDAEVEWIGNSNNNGYLMTDIVPYDSLFGFRVEFTFSTLAVQNTGIFGSRTVGGNDRFSVSVGRLPNIGFGNYFNLPEFQTSKRYVAKCNFLNSGVASFSTDGEEIEVPLNKTPLFGGNEYPIYIFCLNGSGEPYYITSYVRLMNLEITHASDYVGHFSTVRFTNSLGQTEGAMYDRVSKQLFKNAGTGSFIIGPDKQTFTDNIGVLMPQKEVEA